MSISIYRADDREGNVWFIGRTRNLERRAEEWSSRGWTVRELSRVDTMTLARGLEQIAMDFARPRNRA